MGVNITSFLSSKEVSYDSFFGKIIIIDASIFLHNFLSNIRSFDGSLLSDSNGNITSHLIGLLSRTTNLLSLNIKPVFVFDGKPPELKRNELMKRRESKNKAKELFNQAKESGSVDLMRKYAAASVSINSDIVEDSKKLLSLLGCPYVQAPSEAEAQASFMVKKGDGVGVASQDADVLLFGSPILLRNFFSTQKKKVKNKLTFDSISPLSFSLQDTLKKNEISLDQLIYASMLIGTDYNTGGIKKIGPVNAFQLVKQFEDPEELFSHVKWDEFFDVSWKEVFDMFKNPKVTEDYDLTFSSFDEEGLKKFLINEREFSDERVDKAISNLKKSKEFSKQKGLGAFS